MKKYLALIILLFALPCSATDYYVRQGGNNGNAGTGTGTGDAWATIQYGVQQLSAGDTLHIMDDDGGTYTENVDVDNNCNDGSAWDNAITVQAQTGDTVILDGGTSDETFEIFNDRRYWIFNNLIFEDGTGAAFRIWAGDYIRFNYCTFRECVTGPGSPIGLHIWVGNAPNVTDNIQVYNSTFVDNQGEGIYLASDSTSGEVTNVIIEGNEFIDNSEGIDLKDDAISVQIRYNYIYWTTSDRGADGSVHGIVNDGTATLIEYNLIKWSGNSGIRAGSGALIRYNIIIESGQNSTYETYSGDIEVDGNSAGGDDNEIYGNTCYGGRSNMFFENAQNTSGNIVKNNIFSSGVNNVFKTTGDPFSGNTIDYNIYYKASGELIDKAGVTKTFAEWQGLGFEANGQEDNPDFTNGPSYDFTLQAGSPAIDSGLDLVTSTDCTEATCDDALNADVVIADFGIDHSVTSLDQDLYGSGWDVGAYEYSGELLPVMTGIQIGYYD